MTNTSYFAFARHALVAGLKHLHVQPGDEVAIPELICRDVLSSVHAVGAIPRFYPVDRNLRPIGLGEASEAQFVLAVNYFGFPQQLGEFTQHWPKAVLIEDNAHGYLSKDVDGRRLGSRTVVGITSFRKTIRVPDGASLTTINSVDNELVLQPVERRPSLAYRLRVGAANTERATNLPLQKVSRSTTRLFRRLLTGTALPASTEASEFNLPEPIAMSTYALTQLSLVDEETEVQRRRQLFRKFANEFSKEFGVPVFPHLPDQCSPYGYPFYSSKISPSLLRLAHQHHCEVIRWPDLPSAVGVPSDHFYRQLHVVNFL